MNPRALLHTIAAAAVAIGAGTLVIPGVPHDLIVSLAGIVAFVINAYMAFTTTGESKASAAKG